MCCNISVALPVDFHFLPSTFMKDGVKFCTSSYTFILCILPEEKSKIALIHCSFNFSFFIVLAYDFSFVNDYVSLPSDIACRTVVSKVVYDSVHH